MIVKKRGITFTERYGCYSATLGGIIPVGFHWKDGGYVVSVGGISSAQKYRSAEEAADAIQKEVIRRIRKIYRDLTSPEEKEGA